MYELSTKPQTNAQDFDIMTTSDQLAAAVKKIKAADYVSQENLYDISLLNFF